MQNIGHSDDVEKIEKLIREKCWADGVSFQSAALPEQSAGELVNFDCFNDVTAADQSACPFEKPPTDCALKIVKEVSNSYLADWMKLYEALNAKVMEAFKRKVLCSQKDKLTEFVA